MHQNRVPSSANADRSDDVEGILRGWKGVREGKVEQEDNSGGRRRRNGEGTPAIWNVPGILVSSPFVLSDDGLLPGASYVSRRVIERGKRYIPKSRNGGRK